jgi:hypothetical protein
MDIHSTLQGSRFAKLISRINRRISIGAFGRPPRDRDSNHSTAGYLFHPSEWPPLTEQRVSARSTATEEAIEPAYQSLENRLSIEKQRQGIG